MEGVTQRGSSVTLLVPTHHSNTHSSFSARLDFTESLPCLSPGGAGGNVWAGGDFVRHKELSRTRESLVVSLVCLKGQPHQRCCWMI